MHQSSRSNNFQLVALPFFYIEEFQDPSATEIGGRVSFETLDHVIIVCVTTGFPIFCSPSLQTLFSLSDLDSV